MDYKTALAIFNGELPTQGTKEEIFMLSMGACLEDDGTIICLTCGKPNECCDCGREEEDD